MSSEGSAVSLGVEATRNAVLVSPGPNNRTREPALLFALILYWAMVIALVMSIVGLLLAVIGVFHPIVLVVIAVPASGVLGVAAWGPFRLAASELIGGGILPVAAVVIVLIASSSSAAFFSAEHLMTDRDPGVYTTTGRWLADEGTLLMSGAVGGFADLEGVTAGSPGYYEVRDDGTVDPQFLHLLPVWAAAAHWIGGDQALLRVNAVVVALALAALWLFAATVLRPWFAVLAVASVSVILPTVHFARDLYSEPMALLFIFAGLALLTLARLAARPGLSLMAGLTAGAVTMVRIDGWMIVIPVVGYLLAVWWSAQEAGTDSTISRFVRPALLGILVSGSVALLDGIVRSRPYFVIRAPQVAMMFGLLVVVVLVGLVALSRPQPFQRSVGWLARHRRLLAWLIPIAIIMAGVALFSIRPILPDHSVGINTHIESIQQSEGLVVDGTRTYDELSMHWLSWYLGVFGLALGVLGIAWAWRKAILGLRDLWPFLLVVSLTAAVYLLRPSIASDQLWAMRRFLPVVLPGLIIAAVLATQWAVERTTIQPLRWGAIVLVIGILIAIPASFTWPLRTSTSYVGMYDALEEVCAAIPEGSAVLITSRLHANLYQASVRSFCGVPVSGIRDSQDNRLCVIAAANQAWADRGVNLIIGYGDGLELEPDLSVNGTHRIPEITVTRRPRQVVTHRFALNVADADGLDTSACPPR